MLPRTQKGIIQLGIIGILFLVGAIAVGTKLVSNKNFTFFNSQSQAASAEKANCNGCVGSLEKRWDNKSKSCRTRESVVCGNTLKKERQNQKSEVKNTGADAEPCDNFGKTLECSHTPLEGAFICKNNPTDAEGWFCCPTGKKILNRTCQ